MFSESLFLCLLFLILLLSLNIIGIVWINQSINQSNGLLCNTIPNKRESKREKRNDDEILIVREVLHPHKSLGLTDYDKVFARDERWCKHVHHRLALSRPLNLRWKMRGGLQPLAKNLPSKIPKSWILHWQIYKNPYFYSKESKETANFPNTKRQLRIKDLFFWIGPMLDTCNDCVLRSCTFWVRTLYSAASIFKRWRHYPAVGMVSTCRWTVDAKNTSLWFSLTNVISVVTSPNFVSS